MIRRSHINIFIATICMIMFSCSSSKLNKETGLPSFTRISKQFTLPNIYKAIDEGVNMIQLEVLANNKERLIYFVDSVEKYVSEKKKGPQLYMLEMKGDANPGPLVEMVMNVVNEKQLAERVVVTSFDIKLLQNLHQRYPTIKTALASRADNKNSFRKQLNDLDFTPTIYYAEYPLINDALVKDCHNRKIILMTWAVNDKEEVNKLRKMGVRGIMTDHPDLLNE